MVYHMCFISLPAASCINMYYGLPRVALCLSQNPKNVPGLIDLLHDPFVATIIIIG